MTPIDIPSDQVGGVRPGSSARLRETIRNGIALVVAVALAGCANRSGPDAAEDFDTAVARMQADPAFLASRAADPLLVVETPGSWDERTGTRMSACRLDALLAAGWRVLPAPGTLAEVGVVYGSPQFADDDHVSVDIGPAESESDASFVFERRTGRWMLVGIEIFGHTAATPAPPCGPR